MSEECEAWKNPWTMMGSRGPQEHDRELHALLAAEREKVAKLAVAVRDLMEAHEGCDDVCHCSACAPQCSTCEQARRALKEAGR